MKIKYFYQIGLVFFGIATFVVPNYSFAAALDKEDLAEIQKIKEHNKKQEKNRVSLDKFQKENPNSMTARSEEYWDLAWHARLADYGDEESQFVIAQAYDTGHEVDQNPKKAVAFYEKAGDQGHIDACMRLGEIYRENKWLKKDDEKSLYWYSKAAKAGYVQAQLKVSELYKEKGDYEAAVKWLETGLKQLFPDVTDLTMASPELVELRRLAVIQRKMNARGVQKNVLHENCFTSFEPRHLKEPVQKSVISVPEKSAKVVLQPFKKTDTVYQKDLK